MWETWVQSLGWEDPVEKEKATPVFWLGEFHELYSPWDHKESDTTEPLSTAQHIQRFTASTTKFHLRAESSANFYQAKESVYNAEETQV